MLALVFALVLSAPLAYAKASPPRPVNICQTQTFYLIADPPPQGYRCLAPVRPIGNYQEHALIQTQTVDFYGCNKQCFIDGNCRAQLFEPFNDGSGNGNCSTYNKPGGNVPGRVMRGDPNAQFSNEKCIYVPSCLQIQVIQSPNNPAFDNLYWNTVLGTSDNGDPLTQVVLSQTPQFYYFDITGRFISDFNGYPAQAPYPAPIPVGTLGQTPPVAFPDDAQQQSGDYDLTSISCGFDGQQFTCGSQAGGTLFACDADNIVRNSKDEVAGNLPGCSNLEFTIIR